MKAESINWSDFLKTLKRLIKKDHILDLRVVRGLDGDIVGFQLLLTYGGPTKWVDTALGVYKYTWGDKIELIPVPAWVCEEINDLLIPLFS